MPRFSPDLVVDADNAVVGRLASSVAKELLKGRRILIANADQAVVSGTPEWVKDQFLQRIHRGDPYHGPFYPKQPDRILRRIVWGMLPRKPRGKAALARLRVQCGPAPAAVRLPAAENTLATKFTTLAAISKHVGGSVHTLQAHRATPHHAHAHKEAKSTAAGASPAAKS